MSWLKHHPLSSLDTAPAERNSDNKGNESNSPDTRSIYSNVDSSNRGYGTDDTLTITYALEEHDIPYCLVSIVAALVFYGAGGVRDVGSSRSPISLSVYIGSNKSGHFAGLGNLRSNRARGQGCRAITIRSVRGTISPGQAVALL